MNLKIAQYDITIKEALTWGDVQQVQSVMASGAKLGNAGLTGYDASAMLDAKYKLLELAITEIKENDKVIPFSKAWMNALSNEDGERLYEAVDALNKKKST